MVSDAGGCQGRVATGRVEPCLGGRCSRPWRPRSSTTAAAKRMSRTETRENPSGRAAIFAKLAGILEPEAPDP